MISRNISATAASFRSFGQLPAELRLWVWKKYLTEDSNRRMHTQLEWRGSKFGFKSRSPIRACLQINQESRCEAVKYYGLRFPPRTKSGNVTGHVRYNLGTDSFYLSRPKLDPFRNIVGRFGFQRLFTHVPGEELRQLRRLAIDIEMVMFGQK